MPKHPFDKDNFVACPIDKAIAILDEDGKFLFATSAKHVIEGLNEHEKLKAALEEIAGFTEIFDCEWCSAQKIAEKALNEEK